MIKYERKCICCGCDNGPAGGGEVEDDFRTPPLNAVSFVSHGNYGSSVFDSISGSGRLEIYICDKCLKNPVGSIYFVEPKPFEQEVDVQIFDPDKHHGDYND